MRDLVALREGAAARLAHAFDHPIDGGPSLTRALFTAFVVLFWVQVVTGSLLALSYVPSPADAWASVFFLEEVVRGGWLVRGVHHHAAQAMLVVLGAHLVGVTLAAGYREPNRARWWAALALVGLLFGLLITGHRLTWDQNTYWALLVEANIAGAVPVVGPALRRVALGGVDVGVLSLTRLHALHVVVLPLLAWGLVAFLRRRQARADEAAWRAPGTRAYYPGQLARDAAVLFAVGAAVFGLTLAVGGAPLGGPAEPLRNHPARPEWFILPLYGLRSSVPPSLEIAALTALPGLLVAFLAALPWLDRRDGLARRAVVLAPAALAGAAAVGLGAVAAAHAPTDEERATLEEADRRRDRAFELARAGIPPGGPLVMFANDPLTRGRDVYAQYCTSCHILDGEGERKAPDHTGFASQEWIFALLHTPDAPHFFGETPIDDMPSQSEKGDPALRAAAAFLFSLGVREGEAAPDAALVARGRALWTEKCMTCHVFEGDGDFLGLGGPDLTGYGTLAWLVRQTADPEAHYGDLNEMPAFDDQLSEHDLRLVSEFLRLQRFEPAVFPEGLEDRPEAEARAAPAPEGG